MRRRFVFWAMLVLALTFSAAIGTPAAGAAIAPPWCGTPSPDGTADGPVSTEPGSFPHIPYYAIGCTLNSIAAQSNGRMTVAVIGRSALGRDMYLVTINALDTHQQRRDFRSWRKLRRLALKKPAKAQRVLARLDGDFKIPLYIQAGIHGNESESVDASLELIERLATTPSGADPEVDKILNHSVVLFNVVHNPDGRVADRRQNGNGFDLNRDFLTQSQSETRASVAIMQKWIPAEVLDLHGYVTPTLVEATTKPHNPSIEYDLWLKWNQARIDANEAAMNAIGLAVTRPINDWCPEGDLPRRPDGLCDAGETPGPAVAEGWDDWGPFYTPMYAQHVGLNGSTVEMCNELDDSCGVPGSTTHPKGRVGAKLAQYTVSWSTLLFDTDNRQELTHDQYEIYRRGVTDAPRPACCPPPFDVANNWMTDYPKAYVIPLGQGQRSDPEANRLVSWLLTNGIRVSELEKHLRFGGQIFERDSYVVWIAQAKRGLAGTSLGIGSDISASINQLYAPPAAWSHGYLWGADIVTIPDGASFRAKTERIRRPNRLEGGTTSRRAHAYALEVDSPAAVRALNALLGSGLTAELATAEFTAAGAQLPAGTVLFSANARKQLDETGENAGLVFHAVRGPLPAREAIDRSPRIAVLQGGTTAATDQNVWSLRNLGFTATPVPTSTLQSAATDPLLGHDVLFNSGQDYPSEADAVARARLTAFFVGGGGYIGAQTAGANFLTAGAQTAGVAVASRGGGGRSGIVKWLNTGGRTSPIVGAYPGQDTAIMDPPTWFTSAGTLAVDGRFPTSDILASGFWLTSDTESTTAPGSAVIAHGLNTAGTSRLALFAMNPLYRADPEREWPMLGSAALWADQ